MCRCTFSERTLTLINSLGVQCVVTSQNPRALAKQECLFLERAKRMNQIPILLRSLSRTNPRTLPHSFSQSRAGNHLPEISSTDRYSLCIDRSCKVQRPAGSPRYSSPIKTEELAASPTAPEHAPI